MKQSSPQWTLRAWGRFVRENRSEYLGYPKRNVIHRMMIEGPGASQATSEPDIDIHPDVARVDKAIGEIPGLQKDVLYSTYVYRMSLRRGAKALEINRNLYERTLGYAEQRIAGYIAAHNNIEKSVA